MRTITIQKVVHLIITVILLLCFIEYYPQASSFFIFSSQNPHEPTLIAYSITTCLFYLGGGTLLIFPLLIACAYWSYIQDIDRILSSILGILYCSYIQAATHYDMLACPVAGGFVGQYVVTLTQHYPHAPLVIAANIACPLIIITLITRIELLSFLNHLLLIYRALKST